MRRFKFKIKIGSHAQGILLLVAGLTLQHTAPQFSEIAAALLALAAQRMGATLAETRRTRRAKQAAGC